MSKEQATATATEIINLSRCGGINPDGVAPVVYEVLVGRVAHVVSERDALLSEVAQLREALDQSARERHAIGWAHYEVFEACDRPACIAARALLGKEGAAANRITS